MNMFRILAAILHLGNVNIVEAIDENDSNAEGECSIIPVSSVFLFDKENRYK